MSQKIVLLDDLDQTEADVTVSFSVEGKHYEIDLSEKNRAAFEKALGKYVSHARVVKVAKDGQKRTVRTVQAEVSQRAVREWAAVNGIEVNPRGRIPQDVIDQYRAAGN